MQLTYQLRPGRHVSNGVFLIYREDLLLNRELRINGVATAGDPIGGTRWAKESLGSLHTTHAVCDGFTSEMQDLS